MAKFHLLHAIPNPRLHGLNGYIEVIESFAWGFQALGHEVSYAINKPRPDATNILFGAQMVSEESLGQLPKDTIVYNMEQLRGLEPMQIRKEMHYAAEHFRIWDYSVPNLEQWQMIGAEAPIHVPISYAPNLTRIPRETPQDIEVLIYGVAGPERLDAFHWLSKSNIITVFVSGLYGKRRDELIARSKLVLNVNLYEYAQIFEIVRVSYLFANRKAVVALLHPDATVEEDVRGAIKVTNMDALIQDCYALIQNDEERAKLEEKGFEAFSKRDIREVLERALG